MVAAAGPKTNYLFTVVLAHELNCCNFFSSEKKSFLTFAAAVAALLFDEKVTTHFLREVTCSNGPKLEKLKSWPQVERIAMKL